MTRYRVRAVGPAGADYDPYPPFSSLCEAWTAAEVYSGEHPGLYCDVIDLENPEALPGECDGDCDCLDDSWSRRYPSELDPVEGS